MKKRILVTACQRALPLLGLLASQIPAAVLAQDGNIIEEVLVTGSHIRRKSQMDSPSPLSMVSREDMLAQGASTVVDVTKNLPENSGAEFQVDNLFQPLTSGTSNINLRNLGLNSTLVLVNGQRQTLSAVAATDGSSFVDINSLMPFIAIERIGVLKDGAEGGASVAQNKYDTLRFAASLEGRFSNDWYWTLQGGYSEQEVDYDRPDTLQSRAVAALTGEGGPNNNQYWNPIAGADNDPAVIEDMFGSTNMNGKTSLTTVDAIVSGDLVEMGSGTLQAAFGAHYRVEDLDHDWGDAYNNQELLSLFGGPDYSDDRDIYALFTEFSIPFTSTLKAQVSARYEDYGSGMNSLDPKIALLWRPTEQVSVRASAGTAFRAASLFQGIAVQSSQANIYDPLTDSMVFRSIQTNGDPDLDPEEADVFNFGVSWSPLETLELSVDYWAFQYDDLIVKQVPDVVVAQEVADTQAGLVGTPAQLAVTREPASNLITLVQTEFINASSAETDGLDLGWTWDIDTSVGAFRWGGSWTWVNSYDLKATSDGATIDAVGKRNKLNFGRSMPEWKGNTNLAWALRNHSAVAYLRYTDGYLDDGNGLDIDDHTTIDLRYSYVFEEVGPGDITLAVGAINVTDEDPPEVQDLLGYDTKVHDPRGRMWYLNLKYSM